MFDPRRPTYLDFELTIRREGERFRALVIESGGRVKVSDLFEPRGLNVQGYRKALDNERSDAPDQAVISPPEAAEGRPSSMEEIKSFGQHLFKEALPQRVYAEFSRTMEQAKATGNGVRFRINIDESAAALASLPWENLWDTQKGLPFAVDPETPIVRSPYTPEGPEALQTSLPLRVLVMAANPDGRRWLDVEGEWRAMSEALSAKTGIIDLHRLDRPTLDDLDDAMLRSGPWHVFHFMGHGGYSHVRRKGHLLMEDDAGDPRPVDVDQIMAVLAGQPSLKLVVLNACKGAQGASTDPFAGVAPALIQLGIPAVVAMQFPISDRAARAFADRFYPALADGAPVDEAVNIGRRAIWLKGSQEEFGTPVLYLHAPDGKLFDMIGVPPVDADETVRQHRTIDEPVASSIDTVASFVQHVVQACREREGRRPPDAENGAGDHDRYRLLVTGQNKKARESFVAAITNDGPLPDDVEIVESVAFPLPVEDLTRADAQTSGADAVIVVLDSGRPIDRQEVSLIDSILAVRPNVYFAQTGLERYPQEWKAIQARNEDILRAQFSGRLVSCTVRPVSNKRPARRQGATAARP